MRSTTPVGIAIAVAIALTASAGPASAETFTVTSKADAGGSCFATPDACTLRQAINTSNVIGSDDRIAVTAGEYELGSQLTIAKPNGTLAIDAAGATLDAQAGDHRVMSITAGSVVTIKGAAFVRGRAVAPNGAEGGGLRISAGSTVVLDHVTVNDNKAFAEVDGADGGGIWVHDSTLTVTDSLILGNSAEADEEDASGGGIFGNAAAIAIERSSVTDNEAAGDTAGAYGGGIALIAFAGHASLSLTDSYVSDNVARTPTGAQGGGVHSGAGSADGADVTVTRSTIEGNKALAAAGAYGGGIYQTDPNLTGGELAVVNSTIDGNVADSAVAGYGGGARLGGVATFEHVTLTSNDASHEGGGYHLIANPLITLRNSLLSGNQAPVDSACGGTTNEPTLFEGNLIDGTGPTCLATGVLTTADPQLGPLAGNGGPTQTRALAAGSPALDRIGTCPAPANDQRGVARPQGSACDIGAFEREPTVAVDNLPAAAADPPAATRLVLTLSVNRRQRLSRRGIVLTAGCGSTPCTTGAKATATLLSSRSRQAATRKRRRVAFTPIELELSAGKTATAQLKLSKRNYAKLAAALRRSKSLAVAVSLTATDALGRTVSSSASVKLLRPKPRRKRR